MSITSTYEFEEGNTIQPLMNSKHCMIVNYYSGILFFFFFLSLVFLRLYLQHMEVPRLGVESELQLLAHTAATATRDLSRVCNL